MDKGEFAFWVSEWNNADFVVTSDSIQMPSARIMATTTATIYVIAYDILLSALHAQFLSLTRIMWFYYNFKNFNFVVKIFILLLFFYWGEVYI